MHPSIEHVLQFFVYDHLPEHLQAIAKPFCDLAEQVADLPGNPETTVALRKLLEGKDAAVRVLVATTNKINAAMAAADAEAGS